MSDRTAIRRRKDEHLAICRKQEVTFRRKRTWLEHVHLVHQAVPAFSTSEVDISVEFLGRRLAAPFVIGAMTGGTEQGKAVNLDLAAVAAERWVGLALGSQRPMVEDGSAVDTFRVRGAAPDILVLGNIGLSQAGSLRTEDVVGLMSAIGADGMCLHLNAAMEMFQADGDDPSSTSYVSIGRLSNALGDRLVVKETGCGIGREAARQLARLGVRTIDVAGAGGTSWVRVENLRRGGAPRGMEEFEEWGIPTAACLIEVRDLKLRTVASGGLRTGLDLAKAIALGAWVGSAALPLLRALDHGGRKEAGRWLDSVIAGLRGAMVLTGCRDLKALRRAPVVLSGPLREWAEERGLRRGSRVSKR